MTAPRQAILLVGSPRGHRSTSDSLGTHLLDLLQEKNFKSEKLYVYPSLRTVETTEYLLESVHRADVTILSFPLYMDMLPAPVIKAMELIRDYRNSWVTPGSSDLHLPSSTFNKKQQFLAIANCLYPEADHNDLALEICRSFSHEAHFEWAGGLALGESEIIGGRMLRKIHGIAKNVKKSLYLTAEALTKAEPVPKEAVNLMARPIIPLIAYIWLTEAKWKKAAKHNGVSDHLSTLFEDQP